MEKGKIVFIHSNGSHTDKDGVVTGNWYSLAIEVDGFIYSGLVNVIAEKTLAIGDSVPTKALKNRS